MEGHGTYSSRKSTGNKALSAGGAREGLDPDVQRLDVQHAQGKPESSVNKSYSSGGPQQGTKLVSCGGYDERPKETYWTLTRCEEVALSERKDRDDTAAFNILWEGNRHVVDIIAKKYAVKALKVGLELVDLVQEGQLGLQIAIKKYDCEDGSGARLSTWAEYEVRGKIIKCIRKAYKTRGLSLDAFNDATWAANSRSMDEDEKADLGGGSPDQQLFDKEDRAERKRAVGEVWNSPGVLTDKQRKSFELRYGLDRNGLCGGGERTAREVSDLLGVKESSVSEALDAARVKLARAIRAELREAS